MNNQAINLKAEMVHRLGEFHGLPVADGVIHRFHVMGDKPGSRNGWYVFTVEERAFACYGSWRTHEKWIFSEALVGGHANATYKAPSHRLRAMRNAQALGQVEAKRDAQLLWANALEAPTSHPYLVRKRCHGYGLRVCGSELLIPMFVGQELVNLQRIYPDGRKYFLKGGLVAGAYHLIPGTAHLDDVLFVCEGWATGASLASMTGCWVACAFNAGNLLAVAQNLRRIYPDARLIIAGDDDRLSKRNTGKEAALKVANSLRCEVVFPRWPEGAPLELSDFNDLYMWEGHWK